MRSVTIFFLVTLLIVGLEADAQSRRSKRDRKANLILSTVKSHIGTPYKYGGISRSGIDCSGLIYLSYNQAGIKVPRTAKDQSKHGKNVNWNRIEPGDLVFFKFKQKGEKWWHSGVITIVENNRIRFVHASSSRGVVESDLLNDYYRKNVKGFRRVL